MSYFLGEFIGTAALLLLGSGVVANCLLAKTKGNQGGLIVITVAWGIAVFTGVYISTQLGGKGHLNPAVSLSQACLGNISWQDLPFYILAQVSGAFTGAVINWLAYRQHFDATTDGSAQLAVFCTSPAIQSPVHNILTEAIGTFMLVFGALYIAPSAVKLGALDAFPVALLVMGIGMSLGGPTGYAINPARDFGPRLAHFLLPIAHKKSSEWTYSWIPVLGPILGGWAAAQVFLLLQ